MIFFYPLVTIFPQLCERFLWKKNKLENRANIGQPLGCRKKKIYSHNNWLILLVPLEFYLIILQSDATLITLINYYTFFCEKFRNRITSSRTVKSQLTAISLSTEKQATWKDSPKNRDSISFEIDCCIPLLKSSDAYRVKKTSLLSSHRWLPLP